MRRRLQMIWAVWLGVLLLGAQCHLLTAAPASAPSAEKCGCNRPSGCCLSSKTPTAPLPVSALPSASVSAPEFQFLATVLYIRFDRPASCRPVVASVAPAPSSSLPLFQRNCVLLI